jgi:hypothetical protein
MSASTTIRPPKGRTANIVKKKSKQLKDMKSTLALLTPDSPTVREEKSYGSSYLYTNISSVQSKKIQKQSFWKTIAEYNMELVQPAFHSYSLCL